ncbi:hypothetical protein O3M35_002805 [Rhynocoris fuscipes]|uniref:F-box domain-containing protein n=1 Tax=Rhynocoris fuscipes TaxID=488301 RepID=A0AAW1CQM2_9HEMI
MDILKCLPPEISIKILTFLNLKDVLSCSLVSRIWYDLTNTNLIWKRFWEVDLPLKECEVSKDFDWVFKPPCKWKLYYLNHKKVIQNWIDDRYKRHEVNGRWINSTAYDGKTLVINNFGLEVYRIDKGNLIHCQKLSYQKYDAYMCATNTTYIVVKYKPFVLIYHLINDKYKVAHMLYIRDRDNKLICTKERRVMDEVSEQSSLYPLGSNLMCILGNTLYVYMPHVKIMYAWNMKEMICLIEIKAHISDFLYDRERVYICVGDSITVYDENARKCFTVSPKWSIYKMHVNNHILLAVGDGHNEVDICAWDKKTGNLLHNKRMLVSADSLLHPKNDILVDVVDAWPLEKKEIFACNINDNEIIWRTLVGEYSILGDLHSIVADRFLLFCTYSRHIVDIHDSKRGNFLYSLYGIDDDDVFASYDILIYAKNASVKLIIHIYS